MSKLIAKVKESYQVIDSSVYGTGENLILQVANKNFAVCVDADSVTVYGCYQESSKDWKFLPTSKTGKTFATVANFIKSRV